MAEGLFFSLIAIKPELDRNRSFVNNPLDIWFEKLDRKKTENGIRKGDEKMIIIVSNQYFV